MNAPFSLLHKNMFRKGMPHRVASPLTGLTSLAAAALFASHVTAAPLVWSGASGNANWDEGVALDWSNGSTLVSFTDGDDVIFDDTATYFSPNLTTVLQPASVTLDATNSYTFGGVGSIAGPAILTKDGTGTLTINTTNAFSGGFVINNGVVQVGKPAALGASTNAVTINGGTLDIHGSTTMPVLNYYVQGTGYTNAGAIVNFSTTASQNGNGIASLILTGDTTIGAYGARWDVWGLDAVGSTGILGNGFNLTKVGPQQIWLNDGGTNTGFADINVLAGLFGIQGQSKGPGTGLGINTNTMTVFSGAAFGTYRMPAGFLVDKQIVMSNATYEGSIGAATFTGPWTLYGTNTQINGYAEAVSDQVNFNGPISGSGGWIKTDLGIDEFNGTNTYSGETIVNAGQLVVGANSSLGNSALVQVGTGAILDVSALANGLNLGAGQELAVGNSGTVSGNVIAGPGSTFNAGINGPALVTLGSLTLSSSTNIVTLGDNASDESGTINSFIQVNGNLNLSGLNQIQIIPSGTLDTNNVYTIIQYNGTLTGSLANLTAFSFSPGYTFTVLDPSTTAPYIEVKVSGSPQLLLWVGNDSATPGVWDLTSTNWLNTTLNQNVPFNNFDSVTFDDSAATGSINLTKPVNASMTFSNVNLNYTLSGTGQLSGTLDLEGSGSVALALSNVPSLSSIIVDSGTLAFDLPATNTTTLSSTLSDNGYGLGTLVQGGNGTLLLTANNLYYSGAIEVTNGLLQYSAATALGQAISPLYVTNNGTLSFNDLSAGSKNIIVSGTGYNGQGALNDLSTSTASHVVIANLTLAGNTTVGANGRWDFPSSGASANGGTLNGNGYDLAKVGPGEVVISPAGGTGLGNIHVIAGTLLFGPHVTDLGDPTKTVTVESNATLYFYGTPAMVNKILVMNSGNLDAGLTSPEGSPNFIGPITFNGTNTIYAGTSTPLYLWGPINGPGGFIKTGTYALNLYGTNTYSGPTIINASSGSIVVGTNSSLGSSRLVQVGSGSKLDVSALTAFNFSNGQTLAGSGTVVGQNINFGSGAILAEGLPGLTTYTLTINGNLALQAGSTNLVKVNKAASLNNDHLTGLNSVQFGGTLVVSNVASALAAGDAIPLVAATNYTGNFAAIIPSTPGAGLTWDTSTLDTDGTLRVLGSGLPTTPTNIVAQVQGNQLVVSWPANYTGWQLQVQTNALNVGLSNNWINVPNSAATNKLLFPIDSANGSVFYRLIYQP